MGESELHYQSSLPGPHGGPRVGSEFRVRRPGRTQCQWIFPGKGGRRDQQVQGRLCEGVPAPPPSPTEYRALTFYDSRWSPRWDMMTGLSLSRQPQLPFLDLSASLAVRSRLLSWFGSMKCKGNSVEEILRGKGDREKEGLSQGSSFSLPRLSVCFLPLNVAAVSGAAAAILLLRGDRQEEEGTVSHR